MQITVFARGFRDAASANPQGTAIGSTCRDFHADRGIQCRHRNRVAERQLCKGHRHRDQQVIAFPGKDLVSPHVDGHKQVTGWFAVRPGFALACQAHLLPVDNTGRDPHGNRTGPVHGSASRAGLTGVGDLGTSAVAVRTRLGKPKGSPVFAGVASAVALPAGGLFSGFRSGAVAGSARCVAAQL